MLKIPLGYFVGHFYAKPELTSAVLKIFQTQEDHSGFKATPFYKLLSHLHWIL